MESILIVFFIFLIIAIKISYNKFRNEYIYRVDVNFIMINNADCNYKCTSYRRGCRNKYCANKLFRNIFKKIEWAQNTIDISMYNFTNYELVSHILRANSRGVKIRIILDGTALMDVNENGFAYRKESYNRLKSAGKMIFFLISHY